MSPPTLAASRPQIQVLHTSDVRKVLALDELCHGRACLTAEELLTLCRYDGHVGLVGRRGGEVDGFLLYHRTPGTIEIAHAAVHPLLRYGTIEKWLFQSVIQRLLSPYRRYAIYLCPERDVGRQKLLAELGFLATRVVKGDEDDFYEMAFDLEGDRA